METSPQTEEERLHLERSERLEFVNTVDEHRVWEAFAGYVDRLQKRVTGDVYIIRYPRRSRIRTRRSRHGIKHVVGGWWRSRLAIPIPGLPGYVAGQVVATSVPRGVVVSIWFNPETGLWRRGG